MFGFHSHLTYFLAILIRYLFVIISNKISITKLFLFSYISMKEPKTQQFAKFFIKDLKIKAQINQKKNSTLDELKFSSVS